MFGRLFLCKWRRENDTIRLRQCRAWGSALAGQLVYYFQVGYFFNWTTVFLAELGPVLGPSGIETSMQYIDIETPKQRRQCR